MFEPSVESFADFFTKVPYVVHGDDRLNVRGQASSARTQVDAFVGETKFEADLFAEVDKISPIPQVSGASVDLVDDNEGPDLLVDWGERNIRGQKNVGSVEAVARLIERYQPDVLVVEDPSSSDCRRWPRVQLLICELGEQAARMNINVRRISRAKVRKAFAVSGASTKYEIARAIASRFPELAPRLPPERKPWMSEDPRMAMFDAAALAYVVFTNASVPEA